MTSKERVKYCGECGQRTIHYIEKNSSTGWKRVTCHGGENGEKHIVLKRPHKV